MSNYRDQVFSEADYIALHTAVHENPSKLKLPSDREAMELVLICAQDIVAAWPTLTLRTMGQMTNRIDTLRQALESIK